MKIYEPQYSKKKQISNHGVTPYFFENIHPEWREFYLITEIFRSENLTDTTYTGVVSPKFTSKAKVTIQEFKNFVNMHSDFDVCFINPFPQASYFYFNIWDQGEIFHPGITSLAQRLLEGVGIPWVLNEVGRTGHDVLGYCNYWVGNERFWKNYVGGILYPIRIFIENNQDAKLIQDLFKPTVHTDRSPIFPFIIERLFTTFLYFSKEIKYIHYPSENLVDSYCLNDIERRIVGYVKPVIDQMDGDTSFYIPMRALMKGLGFSLQQFTLEYYSRRAYPFTGKIIETSI